MRLDVQFLDGEAGRICCSCMEVLKPLGLLANCDVQTLPWCAFAATEEGTRSYILVTQQFRYFGYAG